MTMKLYDDYVGLTSGTYKGEVVIGPVSVRVWLYQFDKPRSASWVQDYVAFPQDTTPDFLGHTIFPYHYDPEQDQDEDDTWIVCVYLKGAGNEQ